MTNRGGALGWIIFLSVLGLIDAGYDIDQPQGII
jgi:hypothetical protein